MREAPALLFFLFAPLFLVLSPIAGAELSHKFQLALASARRGGTPVFVDLDNTLGWQNLQTREWILYRGANEWLAEQAKEGPLVLLTGNLKKNVLELYLQHPKLKSLLSVTITAEAFAPEFARLINEITPAYRRIKNPSPEEWQNLLFEVWKKHPGRFLRKGIKIVPTPTTVEEWRQEVYLPYINPDKSEIVRKYNGILVDDRFAEPDHLSEASRQLVAEHRGVYAGPVGQETTDSGPDFAGIEKQVREARKLLQPHAPCASIVENGPSTGSIKPID